MAKPIGPAVGLEIGVAVAVGLGVFVGAGVFVRTMAVGVWWGPSLGGGSHQHAAAIKVKKARAGAVHWAKRVFMSSPVYGNPPWGTLAQSAGIIAPCPK